MSLDQWQNTINTNLTSSFLVARDYLRNLETLGAEDKKFASIIFVGSTAGKFGEANHADYAASKSGMYCNNYFFLNTWLKVLSIALMYGLTSTLKNEIVKIAPKGRVNCVAPGWVKTVSHSRFAFTPFTPISTSPQSIAYLPAVNKLTDILFPSFPTLIGISSP